VVQHPVPHRIEQEEELEQQALMEDFPERMHGDCSKVDGQDFS
jgi:hypothetical protein